MRSKQRALKKPALNRRFPVVGVFVAALLFTGSLIAGAIDQFEAFSTNLKGLDAQFVQRVYGPNGHLKDTSSGRVALSAPNLFRWEYTKPYTQLIVADGNKVWVHDPDLQQVTVRPQGAAEHASPLAALLNPQLREQRFEIVELGNAEGLAWLKLTPRNADDSSFQSARLGFDDGVLRQMQAVDALGQRTLIVFSDLRRNPGFAAGTFEFSPPAGADVISQ